MEDTVLDSWHQILDRSGLIIMHHDWTWARYGILDMVMGSCQVRDLGFGIWVAAEVEVPIRSAQAHAASKRLWTSPSLLRVGTLSA